MSRRERHALLLLLALTVAGHLVRLGFGRPGRAAGGLTLLSAFPDDDLGRQRARSLQLARPLAPGERIDLNTATAEDLARLPGVGATVARRIVAARAADGPFSSLADVDRVPGVGPAVLGRLDSLATLSDTLRARSRRGLTRTPLRPEPPPVSTIRIRDLPVARVGPAQAAGETPKRRLLDLNRATLGELVELRGIGPTRAKAILAYRQSHGPFASVNDLEKVPGLGPGLVRQLGPQVTVR